MTVTGARVIHLAISADCHVGEPLDLWTTRLPASLRARGTRIELRDGKQFAGVPREAVERIAYRNAAEFYRIPLPQW